MTSDEVRMLEELSRQVLAELEALRREVGALRKEVHDLTINQAQLDADLQALGSDIGALITAYEAASAKAAAAGVDLTAEDATVKQLAAQITAAITPPTTTPPVATATLPLYVFAGAAGTAIDTTQWTLAGVETTDTPPRALYTFSGDTAGGTPTGGSAEWVVYTGTTQPVPAPAAVVPGSAPGVQGA
jgi:hypothetical protein